MQNLKFKINGYYLDTEQQAIVLDKSRYLLVVAGAGSGKTLTILGKIGYLVNNCNIKKEEILCISFTREASNSLKQKIVSEFNMDMDVYTFHKLSLEILKEAGVKYNIAASDTLENIIHQFIYIKVLNDKYHMRNILKYFGERFNGKEKYLSFLDKNCVKIRLFERLISSFIHLFKCNGYKLENFSDFKRKIKRGIFTFRHNKCFLIVVLNIYLDYISYLEENNEIDFDDMIIKATQVVKERGINKRYKYIIIDEYQDTSYVRFLLIKEILNNIHASLMVVGDDFQSIYRFTGCNLDLFLNFNKYFQNAKIMKIQNTYRNSQELIKLAGDFVMKNKRQIKKNLRSNKHLDKPVNVIYYDDIKISFKKLILEIYNNTNKPILILGRNNNDIGMVLDNDFKMIGDKLVYLKNKDIVLRYLTVHKSKGLEEENIIIINLVNNMLGFPNKIVDDKILSLVSVKEKYIYAEERRLFYVALTRTKNYAYLLVPRKNPSEFVKELVCQKYN